LRVVTSSYGSGGYCAVNKLGKKTYLPTLKNVCRDRIYCKVCARDGTQCGEWGWEGGQALGGWAWKAWCDTNQLQWWCVSDLEVVNRQCLQKVP